MPLLAATVAASFLALTPKPAYVPGPPADVYVAASSDHATVLTGDPLAFHFSGGNRGPSALDDVVLTVRTTTAFIERVDGHGVPCAMLAGEVDCGPMTLAPSQTFNVDVFATATTSSNAKNVHVDATLYTRADDQHFDDNRSSIDVPVIVAPALVDIVVSADHPGTIPFGPYQRTLTIRNTGTSPARDLRVYVEASLYPSQRVTAASPPWTCTPDDPHFGPRTMCSTPDPLLPGRSTTLTLTLDPKFAGNYDATAVVAYTGGHDRDDVDNWTSLRANVGAASDYESVLFPILASDVPGAGGKVWSTTLMLHTAQDGLPLSGWVTWDGPCLTPFSAGGDQIVGPSEHFQLLWPTLGSTPCEGAPHGMMVYLDNRAAAEATFSLKLTNDPDTLLFDTGATQVPIVRGIASRPNLARILGVTFLPTHRYTLRIYDGAASQDATATVRLVDGGAIEKEIALRLIAPVNQRFANGHQPVFPSYAEVGDEVLQGFRIYNYNEPMLEITSSNPNAHLWAMLVAVDNATQQVTFSSPQ